MIEQREYFMGQPGLLRRLGAILCEYSRLILTLAKLYAQSRVLLAKNFLLSCKLRIWDAVFVYFKIQIFLIRLCYGFDLDECWPAEESLPPVTRT